MSRFQIVTDQKVAADILKAQKAANEIANTADKDDKEASAAVLE